MASNVYTILFLKQYVCFIMQKRRGLFDTSTTGAYAAMFMHAGCLTWPKPKRILIAHNLSYVPSAHLSFGVQPSSLVATPSRFQIVPPGAVCAPPNAYQLDSSSLTIYPESNNLKITDRRVRYPIEPSAQAVAVTKAFIALTASPSFARSNSVAFCFGSSSSETYDSISVSLPNLYPQFSHIQNVPEAQHPLPRS